MSNLTVYFKETADLHLGDFSRQSSLYYGYCLAIGGDYVAAKTTLAPIVDARIPGISETAKKLSMEIDRIGGATSKIHENH
jgi:hypothetical protein